MQDYSHRISYMETQIRAWQWESSSKIMALLNIYGRMTASELREKLQLKGEKSIFKALKVLIDAGRVTKEIDEEDSRISYYQRTAEIVSDPKMDEGFLSYLASINRIDLIADYYNGANMASIGYLKILTDIIRSSILSDSSNSVNRFLSGSLFIETILSISDISGFRKSLKEFLENQIPKYANLDEDVKKEMKDPVGLYIAFMPI